MLVTINLMNRKHQLLLLLCSLLLVQVNLLSQHPNLNKSIDYAWEVKYSNPDTAKYILQSIINEGENENTAQAFAKAHSYLGVIEDIAGNSELAVSHLLQALKIQEKYNFSKDLSFTYNNLGIAFFYQYNYEKALEYYLKSSEVDRSLNDLKGVAGTLINIGIVYTYLDSIERAKEMYLEADQIFTNKNDSIGKTQVALNMAKIYFSNQSYSQALQSYHTSLKFGENTNNPEFRLNAYHGIANVYSQINQLDSALYFCKLANNYALQYNLRERLQYGYDLLSDIYIKQNNYEQAISALKKYTLLRDSLVNEDRNRSIAEMQTKYETEKKDRLIAEMKFEQIANEKERNLFIMISIFVVLIMIFLSIAYRFNKRKNILLLERNKAIEENLQQKETMIGEIHHRVKNNLQLISSIFDLQARTLQDKEAIKAINESKNRVKSMAIIHQKLYQQSDIYGINMKEYIENLTPGIVQTFNTIDQNITLYNDIEEIILHIDTAIPLGLIITEVITNTLKYAYPDQNEGSVNISLKELKNKLILEVSDLGVGIDNSANNKASNSFGMKMITSLARQLRAEWSVTSQNGTKYRFEIKNYKRGEKI